MDTTADPDQGPISNEELTSWFGVELPHELVRVLFDHTTNGDDLTIGAFRAQVRAKARKMGTLE